MPAPAPSQLKRLNRQQRGGNTYRFQGFNDRINSIHLNLHHPSNPLHVPSSTPTPSSTPLDPSSSSSHFLTDLHRQRDLDHSAAFTAVARELTPLCRSFALVVHNKQKILRILIRALTHSDASSSSSPASSPSPGLSSAVGTAASSPAPYLQLLTSLARDLRFDFYPLFPYTLTSLLSILNPAHPEHLHLLFTCLLFLFKFLARQLLPHLSSLHSLYFSRLLRHPRWYIRRFAAESFAYLLRKLPPTQLPAVYSALLALPPSPSATGEGEEGREEEEEVRLVIRVRAMGLQEYRDGVAGVLFHTHKGVSFQLHSLAPASLPLLLTHLRPPSGVSSDPAAAALSHHQFLILQAFFRRLANHTRRDQSAVVWTALSQHALQTADAWGRGEGEGERVGEEVGVELARVIDLVSLWVSFRHGGRIADPALVMRLIQSVTRPAVLRGEVVQRAAVGLVAAFCQVKASQGQAQQLHGVLTALFSPASSAPLPAAVIAQLVAGLVGVRGMRPLLLRWGVGWVEALVRSPTRREGERRDWLTLLLTVCQPIRQYDDFHYAERVRQAEDGQVVGEEEPVTMPLKMPSEVVKQLLAVVVAAVAGRMGGEEEEEVEYAALQLLAVSGVGQLNGLLSGEQVDAVEAVLDERMADGEEEEDDELSVHHLLLAYSLTVVRRAKALPRPASHPPLALLSDTPAMATTSEATTPTTAAIDRLLYMSTRALVSSHLLSASAPLPSSLLQLIYAHLTEMLREFGAHPAVLRSLLSFLTAVQGSLPDSPVLSAEMETITTRLTPALAHPSATIRSLSLHILALYPPLSYEAASTSTASTLSGPCNLLPLLLSLSLLTPTFAHERAIDQQLSSLEVMINSRRLPRPYVRLLPAFLFGQLHVKLSSSWGRAQRCLAALLAGYGEEVGDAFMAELQRSEKETKALVTDEEAGAMRGEDVSAVIAPSNEEVIPAEAGGEAEVEDEADDEPNEEEEEDAAVEEEEDEEEADVVPGKEEAAPSLTLSSVFTAFTHTTTRATDVYTYHALLQKALTMEDAKAFADRRSAPLTGLFLTFYAQQYQLLYPNQDPMPPPPFPLLPPTALQPIPRARKVAKVKLLHFLRLFDAAFTLAHLAVYRSYLPVFFCRLLRHPDAEVQGLALKALSKWRWAWLAPYQPRLQRLVGEGTWREELTAFHLDPAVSPIAPAHRRPLAAVLTRLLYPRLAQTKTQRGKAGPGQKRAAILAYLAGLQAEELAPLISIMLAPFTSTLTTAYGGAQAGALAPPRAGVEGQKAKEVDEAAMLRECSPILPEVNAACVEAAVVAGVRTGEGGEVELGKQVGLLRLLEAVLAQMRSVVRPYLPHLLTVLLAILQRANTRIDLHRASHTEADETAVEEEEEEGKEGEGEGEGVVDVVREQKELRGIRQLVFSRMASVLDFYPDLFHPTTPGAVHLHPFLPLFLRLAGPSIVRLPTEQTQHKGGLLSCVLTLASHPPLIPVLTASPDLLPAAFALLSAPKASTAVISTVLTLCERLLTRQAEADEANAASTAEADALLRPARPRRPKTIDRLMRDSSDEEEEEDEADTQAASAAVTRSRQAARELGAEVERAWRRHISTFLHHMHRYLSTTFSATYYPRRELGIIARVSSYATEAGSVRDLTALLLPFLSHLSKVKAKDWRQAVAVDDTRLRSKESVQHSILSILHSTVSLHPAPDSLVSFLARQFMQVSSHGNRALLAATFSLLAERVEGMGEVAGLLKGMTAVNAGRVDEPDYDRIVEAYTAYSALMPGLSVQQQQPLVYLMLQHVEWEELAVRGQAAQTLKALTAEQGAAVEAAVVSIIHPAIKRGQWRQYTHRGGGMGG